MAFCDMSYDAIFAPRRRLCQAQTKHVARKNASCFMYEVVKSALVIFRTGSCSGASLRFAGRTNASVPTRSLSTPSLLGYGDLFAGVLDRFVCLVGGAHADAVVFK